MAISGRHGIQDSSLLLWMLAVEELYIHVLSCYAPTYYASRQVKDDFYNFLQEHYPPCHQLIATSCKVTSMFMLVPRQQIIGGGPHGYGELNEAG